MDIFNFVFGIIAGGCIGIFVGMYIFWHLIKATVHAIQGAFRLLLSFFGLEANRIELIFARIIFWSLYGLHQIVDFNTNGKFDLHWLERQLKHGFIKPSDSSLGWLPWSYRELKEAHEKGDITDFHWRKIESAARSMQMDADGNFPETAGHQAAGASSGWVLPPEPPKTKPAVDAPPPPAGDAAAADNVP